MATEAAFILNLQHEYLRDGYEKVAACLESLTGLPKDREDVLRLYWQTIHGLKGESQVVGFPFLATFLEGLESALGAAEERLRACTPDAAAIARFASALKEAAYGLEGYLRGLEREYTDSSDLLELHRRAFEGLERWSPEAPADWGMGGAPGAPVEETASAEGTAPAEERTPVEVPDLGDGIVFDADVFKAYSAPSAPAAPVSSSVAADAAPPGVAPDPGHGSTQAIEQRNTAGGRKEHASEGKERDQDDGKSDPEKKLYLVLSQAGTAFAIPLDQVVEIVESRRWNPLPAPKRNILGVVSLRGTILPICDFLAAVGRGEGSYVFEGGLVRAENSRCIVVVSVAGRKFGFAVESVSHVAEVCRNHLKHVDESGVGSTGGIVTHLGLVEGQTILFLDIARLVA